MHKKKKKCTFLLSYFLEMDVNWKSQELSLFSPSIMFLTFFQSIIQHLIVMIFLMFNCSNLRRAMIFEIDGSIPDGMADDQVQGV